MSRQAGADYYGITLRDAAIRSWTELNKHNLNPRVYLDNEHFELAYDHFYWKMARQLDAMLDVFPDMDRITDSFARYYQLNNGDWQKMVVKYIFKRLGNRVYTLLRSSNSLTVLKTYTQAWMNEFATQRDGWMFN